MAIAKLSIDLEARLAGLQAGLDKATFIAERSAARMNSAFTNVNRTLKGVGGFLSVREVVRAFDAVVSGLDALNDAADATGASIENLSALEDIAARNGTAFETVTDAVVKLNKALADAKPGSDAAQVLEQIGLSIAELKRLDPADAFQRVAVALSAYADDGNKARAAQELFGRSLKEVAPLLEDVAEAGHLQAAATTAQTRAAEEFNKQLFALQKNTLDLARAMTGPLISALNQTAQKFREGAKEGQGFWATLLEGPRRLAAVASGQAPLSDLASRGGLIPLLDSKAGAGRGFVNPELVRPSLSLPPPKPGSSGARSRRDDRTRDAEFAARQLVEIEEQAARDAADAWEYWERQQLDLARERAEAEKTQWQQVFDFIDQQQDEAIEQGQAVLKAAKEMTDEWSVFADQAARNIQDALGDTLLSVMEGNFRSIGDSWLRLVNRMVAEALAANLGKALLGDFGKTGQIGGWAGDLLSLVASSFGGARAGGGPVSAGQTYLVGERGPELLHMGSGQGGSITPNGAIGNTYAPVFNFTGPVDRRSVAQIEAAAYAGAARAWARNS